jgi:hypothetical protein
MKYVGLDWAYRTARCCALAPGAELAGEGRIAADRDGLARLVLELGDEVKACLEMMSGAVLPEAEASAMMVSGFVEPITKELPLEYAVEMNRLIQLQMEGSVG